MKVKELIKKLMDFDGETEVWVSDEIEGNDGPLSGVEIRTSSYDSLNPKAKPKTVVTIRWS
jgi:hypothetical protein